MICRYGRNGKYMGGIGAEVWHYDSVLTDAEFLRNIGVWLLQELFFMVLPHWLIHHYSKGKVKVHIIARTLGKNYRWGTLATYGWILYHQMCITIIHCGMDMTFSDWTFARGKWREDYRNPLGLGGD